MKSSTNIYTMENNVQDSKQSCFLRWMNLQEEDLTELLQALNHHNSNRDYNHTSELNQLVDKNISHYEEYVSQRATLARDDVYPYFSPAWCTSLEGSMMWAGGCRPSTFIRLLYTLSGKETIRHLVEYDRLENGGLGDLSWTQLNSVNDLHIRTIRKEDKISAKLASLQEEIADDPIAVIAREIEERNEASTEVDEALDAFSISMTNMLEKAYNLRLNTVKELMILFTPIQAVDYLAAARKLQLCVHTWGRKRDHEHGTN